MEKIEETIKRVLRNQHCATLKELHSFFGGSYIDMCRISDALYRNGCGFIYDPRKLTITTECLGKSMWYRIENETKPVTEGFEMIDHPMGEKEMERHLKKVWQSLDKPEPDSYYCRAVCYFLRYPRDVLLESSEAALIDLEMIPNDCYQETDSGLLLKGKIMTRYTLISQYPERVTLDGVTYTLKSAGLYEGEGKRITLSLTEADELVYRY